MANQSKELEILVANIQRQLSRDAQVLHDVHLPGRMSKRDRQIDVLVRQKIGQYEMLIVIDCKDYSKPVDVKGVEEFHGLVMDIGAHKGALVCPMGFSKAAKERANGLQIDLYSPVDTDPHKWQAKVSVPMICDFRSARIAIGLSTSAPMPMRLSRTFYRELVAYDLKDQRPLGTPIDFALEKWSNGEFSTEPGEHHGLRLYDVETVLVDNGHGQRIPVQIKVDLHVESKLYFGYQSVKRMSGFKDELSGKVITNAFTLGLLNPNEVERSWMPIACESDAPGPAVIWLTGLIGYS